MSLRDDLIAEVKEIFQSQWETRKGQIVPGPEDLQLGNHAVTLDATVLYADLADSTVMVDEQPEYISAEIYKTYMACAARIIKRSGGTITAYDGDRIMAVFIGGTKNSIAAKTGLQITWAVDKILNPAIRRQYGKDAYQVSHVVGIDSSPLRACRIGVRNDNDLVWVGSAANHAAKLSSISTNGSAVYLSESVYKKLHTSSKIGGDPPRNMWTETQEWMYGEAKIYRSGWQWAI